MNNKFVFVTGKDFDSQEKVLVLSSIARLLKSRGIGVTFLKLASCLNIDIQSKKECGVTSDGKEVDSAMGTYERYADETSAQTNYATLGSVIQSVINQERRGNFGGAEVTIANHVVDEIKQRIYRITQGNESEFVLIDINGSPADMAAAPLLEAARQVKYERPNACYFIHYAHEPHEAIITDTIRSIMQRGIQPDALVLTADATPEEQKALAKGCNIAAERVATTMGCNGFEMPTQLSRQNVDKQLLRHFNMECGAADMRQWDSLLDKYLATSENEDLKIAIAGKNDAIFDSLRIAAAYQERDVTAEEDLSAIDGAIICEHDCAMMQWCMEHDVPTLCIADGTKAMAEVFADLVMSLKEEITEPTTLRLGADKCRILPDTKAAKAYGPTETNITECYRSDFRIKSEYRQRFEQAGMMCSGENPDTHSMEIIEISKMRWCIGTMFNPEYSSTVLAPNPIFTDFVNQAINYHNIKNQNG